MFETLTVDELMAVKAELSQKTALTTSDICKFQAAKDELERRNSDARTKYRDAMRDAQLRKDAT